MPVAGVAVIATVSAEPGAGEECVGQVESFEIFMESREVAT